MGCEESDNLRGERGSGVHPPTIVVLHKQRASSTAVNDTDIEQVIGIVSGMRAAMRNHTKKARCWPRFIMNYVLSLRVNVAHVSF